MMAEVTLKNDKGQPGISYSEILSFEDRKGLVLAETRAIETTSRVHVKLSAKALKNFNCQENSKRVSYR
jgi:hypothetical protein